MANEFDYFPLYYRRLFIDTVDMSTLAFGAYMRLLLHAWDQKPVGTLLNDASSLARIARVSDAEWNEVEHAVLSRFKDLEKPRIRQKKMRQVYDALRELANSKSEQGRKAAKAMWDKKKHAAALPEHSASNANKTKPNQTKSPAPRGKGELKSDGNTGPPTAKPPQTVEEFKVVLDQRRSSNGKH